jgi:hypothetical protein
MLVVVSRRSRNTHVCSSPSGGPSGGPVLYPPLSSFACFFYMVLLSLLALAIRLNYHPCVPLLYNPIMNHNTKFLLLVGRSSLLFDVASSRRNEGRGHH